MLYNINNADKMFKMYADEKGLQNGDDYDVNDYIAWENRAVCDFISWNNLNACTSFQDIIRSEAFKQYMKDRESRRNG